MLELVVGVEVLSVQIIPAGRIWVLELS